MRLFCALSILSLLFGVRASSLGSREPTPHPLDARDFVGVCAFINNDKLTLPSGVTIGLISQFNVPLSTALHNDFDR